MRKQTGKRRGARPGAAALSARGVTTGADTTRAGTESERVARDDLADFTRDRRMLTLSVMALVIGAVSALVAYGLVWLMNLITNLAFYQRFSTVSVAPVGHHLGYWVVGVPVLGGLIIGMLARYGSEQIRGHGIPEALEAILIGRSRMHLKIALLKPLSSAISIGTGGPFGAEGPIIMTGGAFGSLFAQAFALSSAERKTLLVAGAAAGMAAIFSAPVSAVLLAVELLLFEWRPRSFIPVALAAAVGATLRVTLLGAGPIFPVPTQGAVPLLATPLALLVGVVAGAAASVMTALVYGCEDLFRKLPLHWMWWPAVAGLVVGLGGLICPSALGVGYDVIHALLRGDVALAFVLQLLIVKTLIWAVALGSGTSGGVLAPLLMIGGALGIVEAHCFPLGSPGFWALISMGAVMAGTMRSPFTAVIFALELTHRTDSLLPLLVASAAAEAVTVFTMRRSILTEKVARRGLHLTREYRVDAFDLVRVAEVMDRNVGTVSPQTTVSELAARISQGDPRLPRHGVFVVDEFKCLVGVVTRGDIVRALRADPHGRCTVLEACTRELVTAHPDELVSSALHRMLRHKIGRLPVVARDDSHHVVGYLGRADVITARLRELEEEHVRTRGGVWRRLSVALLRSRPRVRGTAQQLTATVAGTTAALAESDQPPGTACENNATMD